MIIKELQPGDCFAQHVNGRAVQFEVVDIRPMGRDYQVTFRSTKGENSARYPGNAFVTTSRH